MSSCGKRPEQRALTMASLTWSALTSSTSQVMFCISTLLETAAALHQAGETGAYLTVHLPEHRLLLEE